MKQIMIDGHLGKDAEVATSKNGRKYVKFSVANDNYENQKNVTEWYNVSSFDSFVIEKQIKMLTKGSYVFLTGDIRTELVKKDGDVKIVNYVTASKIDFPRIKRDNTPSDAVVSDGSSVVEVTAPASVATSVPEAAAVADSPVSVSTPSSDDDLPF